MEKLLFIAIVLFLFVTSGVPGWDGGLALRVLPHEIQLLHCSQDPNLPRLSHPPPGLRRLRTGAAGPVRIVFVMRGVKMLLK